MDDPRTRRAAIDPGGDAAAVAAHCADAARERRARLTSELSISAGKSAKIIALPEEPRRDRPRMRPRTDAEADDPAKPFDPQAISGTHDVEPGRSRAGAGPQVSRNAGCAISSRRAGAEGEMVFYVVKCRQGGDASIARRDTAAEALCVIEQASGQGWAVAEITRGRLVIDEAALRRDAELETGGA